jgi:hypothetical protein
MLGGRKKMGKDKKEKKKRITTEETETWWQDAGIDHAHGTTRTKQNLTQRRGVRRGGRQDAGIEEGFIARKRDGNPYFASRTSLRMTESQFFNELLTIRGSG